MNKEIELILTKLKIVSEEEQKGMYLCDKEHSKILLDYITNLEQKNERLNTELNAYKDEFCKDTIKEYELLMEQEYYKSRCEKANEYINNWLFEVGGNGACMGYEDIVEMKNILGGDSNE